MIQKLKAIIAQTKISILKQKTIMSQSQYSNSNRESAAITSLFLNAQKNPLQLPESLDIREYGSMGMSTMANSKTGEEMAWPFKSSRAINITMAIIETTCFMEKVSISGTITNTSWVSSKQEQKKKELGAERINTQER